VIDTDSDRVFLVFDHTHRPDLVMSNKKEPRTPTTKASEHKVGAKVVGRDKSSIYICAVRADNITHYWKDTKEKRKPRKVSSEKKSIHTEAHPKPSKNKSSNTRSKDTHLQSNVFQPVLTTIYKAPYTPIYLNSEQKEFIANVSEIDQTEEDGDCRMKTD
jgi:hypothetical protein